ncbi:MAG: Protein-S-isoprenylcysteine O-methyltransferase Ste14 [Gammaproteobacteria bacterium]|nr:Protein-S-isoprenylcysteine O-methyltransferase Ste14 [Gammaproteobacteria bacterium]
MQRVALREALLRRTGTPVFFKSQVTGTPALQRTASQELRAALRPGNDRRNIAANEGTNTPTTPPNMEPAMIAKLILQTLLYIAGMGALLFIAAGTWHWPAAWVFLAAMAVLGLGSGVWLAKTDPALLAERMRPMMQDEQPLADKKFILVFGAAGLIWFAAIGLDKRFEASDVPTALQALGLAMLVASTGYIMWVMRENSFAAPVVKVQAERGHRVIDTGPYAHVRHPMYSGTVLFFVGMPLLLGSWWGVVLAPLFVVLFAIRAGIEERALLAGLPGYADYAARVRYRLVPGIW